ncbi:MAG: element excision factor XisH family protein [Bacteroidota bacterium]
MARDVIHHIVRKALEKDGWKITHDPYLLLNEPGQEVDLAAEKLLLANKGVNKIAVEIKSFTAASKIYKFYEALGQYISYAVGVEEQEPDRTLYIAMPDTVYDKIMTYSTVPESIKRGQMKFILIDLSNQNIVAWK